ncbi:MULTISPECIES: GNAT family N-acetyltransferase [Microbacterium]|uniref:GNAT family N-acetyltransferase n=1 Tax=Microbacterium TaxID=33882 RepID=UPI00278B8717|nr:MULTISPECIES: GNAT family protein [Microbacterium]MDQ1084124.1 RimJ/RimL family protein N-acetyltransferase [Microbacterium sp. SORGH_AS_0344]MDQ1170600.1 RimJ/RimL family protein N-acetyltransferase [Microbacterium proteolyticum]
MSGSPFVLPPAPETLELTRDRVRLRPFEERDLEAMAAYRGDAEVCRYLPFDPQTPDDIRGRIGHLFGRTSLEGERGGIVLVIERVSDGTVIGDVVLFHLDGGGSAEMGWVMSPAAAGRGLATEAVRALVDTAFSTYGLRRLVARIDADNGRSRALAERLGMRLEAHLVENEWFKGRWSDELDYALLAREWTVSHGSDAGTSTAGE